MKSLSDGERAKSNRVISLSGCFSSRVREAIIFALCSR